MSSKITQNQADYIQYIRQWYSFYATSPVISQQAVGQLTQPPVAQFVKNSFAERGGLGYEC